MSKMFEIMQKSAFPLGDNQIHEEAEMLHAVLNGSIPIDDLKKIIVVTKPLFYLNQQRQKGEVTRINSSIFEKHSKSITENDIELILKFYENYFGVNHSDINNLSSEKSKSSILTHVNLYDQDGYFWGCVDVLNKNWSPKLNEKGIRSVYQNILMGAVIASNRNISDDDRESFTKITMLPKGEWTEAHYNKFAFLFAAWIKYFKYFDETDSKSNLLNQVKKMLQEFNIEFQEIAGNEAVVAIFEKCFVSLSRK
jgi:hypothetical protein